APLVPRGGPRRRGTRRGGFGVARGVSRSESGGRPQARRRAAADACRPLAWVSVPRLPPPHPSPFRVQPRPLRDTGLRLSEPAKPNLRWSYRARIPAPSRRRRRSAPGNSAPCSAMGGRAVTLDDVRREVEEQFAGYRSWRSTLRIQFPESTEEVSQRFQHQLDTILACVQRAFQDYAALRQRMNLGEVENPAQTLHDLLKKDV